MTQLARLDPARSRTTRDGVAACSACSAAELPQLPVFGQLRRATYSASSASLVASSTAVSPTTVSPNTVSPNTAAPNTVSPTTVAPAASPSVPGWTVVSAALCPVLLVGGWIVGGAVQPTSYSPMQQTMSVLAGQTGTDSWVMTGALLLVGATQLATAVGLRDVGVPARVLLVLTGISTIGVASSPEPAPGPTPVHLAFAVSCIFTTAIWPVFVARRQSAPSWAVSIYGCAVITTFFAALSGWMLFATFGGGDLGLAERITSTALGLFPLVVVLSLRQAASRS
jgi:hypothetical protein